MDTREKIHIYKNVLLISISFLLLFTAYESMSKLQSSINSVGALIAARYEYCDSCVWRQVANLGTWSNSAVYASLILSSCFLPSLLIRRLGVKWSLVLSVLCYSFYIAAQFYPEFYTLVPTAVVLGMGAAPLWIAKCSYLTQVQAHPSHPLHSTRNFSIQIAHRLAAIDNVEPEPIVVKFFGIFFFFFQCNSILGNTINTFGTIFTITCLYS